MKKIIINIILVLFLVWSSLLTLAYIGLVIDKILRPEFKNASVGLLTASGILVLGFIICDYYILRYFIRISKRN